VEYRTNQDGMQIRPATVLMTWKREGGIAGFCDYITVFFQVKCMEVPAIRANMLKSA